MSQNDTLEDELRRLYFNFDLAENWSKLPIYRMFRRKDGRFCNCLVQITESVSMKKNATSLSGEVGFIGWGRFVESGKLWRTDRINQKDYYRKRTRFHENI